jgi:hypothetical protein
MNYLTTILDHVLFGHLIVRNSKSGDERDDMIVLIDIQGKAARFKDKFLRVYKSLRITQETIASSKNSTIPVSSEYSAPTTTRSLC